MGQFLYFIPNVDGKVHAQVEMADAANFGIGYAFESKPVAIQLHGSGPDGEHSGVIAAAETVGLGYYPDKQTWHRLIGNKHGVMVGYAALPGPENLIRQASPLLTRSHRVTLGDGNPWRCPVALAANEDDAGQLKPACVVPRLPSQYTETGWQVGDIDARYSRIWQAACKWHDAKLLGIDPEPGAELLLVDAHEIATAALAANYRIAANEVSILRLLTENNIAEIFDALADVPTTLAWAQKKSEEAAAGGSS